jgi:hypothetical protein
MAGSAAILCNRLYQPVAMGEAERRLLRDEIGLWGGFAVGHIETRHRSDGEPRTGMEPPRMVNHVGRHVDPGCLFTAAVQHGRGSPSPAAHVKNAMVLTHLEQPGECGH